jgi:hypothetical protein
MVVEERKNSKTKKSWHSPHPSSKNLLEARRQRTHTHTHAHAHAKKKLKKKLKKKKTKRRRKNGERKIRGR